MGPPADNDLGMRHGLSFATLSLVALAVLIGATIPSALRVGGEEFAFLLPMPESSKAGTALQRIRESLYAVGILAPDGTPWPQTVSAGLTMFIEGEGLDVALGRADHALYLAKEEGRDRIVVG